jgi:proline iminopeptidase
MAEKQQGMGQHAAIELSMEDHKVTLNGVDLFYRTVGEGPVLLMIPPGWGVASDYLQRSFLSLAENYRLVLMDTRGSGRSGRPADSSRMGSMDMAEDIEAMRVHLGLEKISLLGHSNSGAITLTYAERYPDRVVKLVLVSSQVLGLSGREATQKIIQSRETDPRFEDAVRAVVPFFQGQLNAGESDETLETFIGKILPLYLHSPDKTLARAAEIMMGPIASYAFRHQFAADKAAKVDQTEFLGDVMAQTPIVVGREDFICPVPISERLAQGIRGSRLVILEESGHFGWLEEPERFFAELLPFLAS